jgi:hypothetical protein
MRGAMEGELRASSSVLRRVRSALGLPVAPGGSGGGQGPGNGSGGDPPPAASGELPPTKLGGDGIGPKTLTGEGAAAGAEGSMASKLARGSGRALGDVLMVAPIATASNEKELNNTVFQMIKWGVIFSLGAAVAAAAILLGPLESDSKYSERGGRLGP